jgi:multicomponent Na+:H+ antiporter subunit D
VNAFLNFYAAPPAVAEHAAALIVAGPLIAACAAMLAPNARWSWMIASAASVFAMWMALCLAGEVARKGAVVYAMGGFPPPLGIALRVDALGAALTLLVSFVAVCAAVPAGHLLRNEVRAGKHQIYLAGFLLCLAGLLGVVVTGDAFNAFVMLEVSSIGTYALVAVGGERRALTAGFNYLVMGTIGATFFVIGVGFLYAATGTLNMADMAVRLAPIREQPVVLAGFAFVMAGLGVKAAVFPMHGWLPGAYAQAPTPISVLLSGAATKAAFYLIVRFAMTVFGFGGPAPGFLSGVLAPLAAAGVLVGSLQAMQQTELRRVLAFSSVAQAGAILLGLSLGTVAGLAAAALHLLMHGLMKPALFLAAGGGAPRARTIADFAGAGRTAPWTMTAFAVAGASLVGAPLTAGFLSKWRLVEASVQAGWWWAAGVLALSSLAALVYVGRMLEAMFFRPPAEGAAAAREAPLGVLVPLWALVIATVWFGLDARLPLGLAEAASQAVQPAPIELSLPGRTP